MTRGCTTRQAKRCSVYWYIQPSDLSTLDIPNYTDLANGGIFSQLLLMHAVCWQPARPGAKPDSFEA
jgi:hypothetical protein